MKRNHQSNRLSTLHLMSFSLPRRKGKTKILIVLNRKKVHFTEETLIEQLVLPSHGGMDKLKMALNAKVKKKRTTAQQKERKTALRLKQKVRKDYFFEQMLKVNELPDLTPSHTENIDSSDSDDLTIISKQPAGEDFTFLSLLYSNRKAVCNRVSLILRKMNIPHSQVSEKLLTREPCVTKVKGDGNCLFQALCLAITRWETRHLKIRQLVCNHIHEVGPYNSKDATSGPGYLRKSKMHNDAVFGTDVEIFSAAQVLLTDIYVYHKYGSNGLQWLHFPCIHGSGSWKNAIYLDNHTGNGVTGHFDYVTGLK